MIKSVLKEIIIMLLLFVAIVLLLGILFYDYIPFNKVVPNKVSYTMPEELKNELSEGSANDITNTQILVTYEVDETDLTSYQKNKEYVPGKVDPFSSYSTNTATGNTTGGGTSNGGGTTQVKPEGGTNSTGQLFENNPTTK